MTSRSPCLDCHNLDFKSKIYNEFSRSEYMSRIASQTSLAVGKKRCGFPIAGSIELIIQAITNEFSDLHVFRLGSSATGLLTSPFKWPSLPLPSIASRNEKSWEKLVVKLNRSIGYMQPVDLCARLVDTGHFLMHVPKWPVATGCKPICDRLRLFLDRLTLPNFFPKTQMGTCYR